jgi:hypothetical protein
MNVPPCRGYDAPDQMRMKKGPEIPVLLREAEAL